MFKRAVEISGDNRYLHKRRGFLIVDCKGCELGRFPLDDLEIVLVCSRATTCSTGLLNALAERSVPLIICNDSFVPCSILLPIESHYAQARRIRKQAALSVVQRKRLWQELVRSKVYMQGRTLQLCRKEGAEALHNLLGKIQSGDKTNIEGEAARRYWVNLFGTSFIRERSSPGINALLNYGYMILRGAVLRAIMLCGLHPAFGLFHRGKTNTMPLADDLMEPFSPIIDMVVYELADWGDEPELDKWAKERLIASIGTDLLIEGKKSPVSEAILGLCRSFVRFCEEGEKQLSLPDDIYVCE